MSYILNIETATKNCSVSIAKEGKTLFCKEMSEQGFSHAEKLHVFIAESLEALMIDFSDLAAIAVSQGPGSYTGLRIGVSAAKGLCYALNIPLIAIDTLEIVARQLTVSDGLIIPMIDARRMEVYDAIFDSQHTKIRETKAEIITEDVFADFEGTIHLLGDGAMKCAEILNNSRFLYHPEIIYPSAKEMSGLSFDKHKKSDIVDVAYFEPFYLKDFILHK
ncbi:MAG: tRNA (adenosine(37)-N6)-threonylcarbamoyltransferase complex dimerization subunit type 1 TsaB [Flavobacterium sp.]|uniref:tRNA (adenosine(37)-N6)-threonylcarbamoyltransferase complex dimerization subunit type 1 TsaB n=1 Tax=Flavobacterium sp. Leaf359 TaxID=1736351 RepID=UPI0006F9F59E|nr:tRNA (adenosine(37)-N6)-threonylcarbamoyltransferase complex dimerization subunit type 1 TsaB [Flavobacterium sp. Leaf359]KQS50222.1 tRNA threonylcarbamoyladenosine biosynthesis protein TsaB [Flavobacterium sp. Leaf359]MBU7570119.1 tRNA (adenosine(37)-N6)-threonylcarbamoyltransferase complex dimerization subunit type 1 TsaB [Flavobacterium sp.]